MQPALKDCEVVSRSSSLCHERAYSYQLCCIHINMTTSIGFAQAFNQVGVRVCHVPEPAPRPSRSVYVFPYKEGIIMPEAYEAYLSLTNAEIMDSSMENLLNGEKVNLECGDEEGQTQAHQCRKKSSIAGLRPLYTVTYASIILNIVWAAFLLGRVNDCDSNPSDYGRYTGHDC